MSGEAALTTLFKESKSHLSNQALREVILAASGVKVSRLLIEDDRLPGIVSILEKAGLHIGLHDRKQVLAPDKGKGGWVSAYGLEVPVESPVDGCVPLYLGTDPEKVIAARNSEIAGEYAEFGRILGYPECCIAFYSKHLREAENDQGDFVLPSLAESVKRNPEIFHVFPALTNIAAQYFGHGLISFYPCSFRCEAALAKATEALAVLQKYDHSLAEEHLAAGRIPVLYTEYEGIYRFPQSSLRGDMLDYAPDAVESSLCGVLSSVLAQGDALRLISNHCVEVLLGDRLVAHLESPQLSMLVFE